MQRELKHGLFTKHWNDRHLLGNLILSFSRHQNWYFLAGCLKECYCTSIHQRYIALNVYLSFQLTNSTCKQSSCRQSSCRQSSCRQSSCRQCSCRQSSCRQSSHSMLMINHLIKVLHHQTFLFIKKFLPHQYQRMILHLFHTHLDKEDSHMHLHQC